MILIKDKALVYSLGNLFVTPYPTENLLAKAFLKFEEDGIMDRIWYAGSVSIGWFINEYSKNKAILALWVKTRNSGSIDKDLDLAGLAWFNEKYQIGDSKLCKAEVGIGFLRAFQKRSITLPLAAMACEWALDNLGVYALFGTTPEPNVAAIRFFKQLGWGSVGPIPNYTTFPDVADPVGVYISFTSQKDWAVTRGKHFVQQKQDNF